ncbi:MAG: type II toxin-antitoxin system VapC family toxin [Balneolaceae bacterium]
MIVVDTNIIAHFWFPSENTQICDNLFNKDPEWLAPILWKSEFKNVVSLYFRKNLINITEALQVTEKAEKQMKDREFHINTTQVYNFVSQSQCSSYDCEFISLADDLNIKLVTFNKQILRAFPQIAIVPNTLL